MRRGHCSKLVLICTAILGLALPAETAAPQSSPLRAPAKDEETAAPVLNPAIYHHVAQVIWVVGDLDRVVEYWQRLGVRNVHRDGVVSFPNLTYRGTRDPATAKQVTANIGELEIKWIQPVHGGKFWSDGLRQHGDGIRVLGADSAVGIAQDAYELAVLRYREGLGNYLQVLSAESQVLGQKSLRADLAARGRDVSVNLARALGGGYEPGEARTELTGEVK